MVKPRTRSEYPAFTITSTDISKCPLHRLDAKHYRADGSCICGPAKPVSDVTAASSAMNARVRSS